MGKVYSIVENDTGEICGEIDDKAYNKITKQPTVKQLAVHQKYKERQCEVESQRGRIYYVYIWRKM